ncbi:MAG: class I SAM-dependent methyltransferase [Prochlorococcus marinus CUG1439]|uniref:class I SAM-dependent methyltransferase n=1 Tax=Prochlorococcus sp. MIT 1314 TaxID=3096220 RepID=UPI001B19C5B4|nr:class I SAM-dependent methyltransferase [Prochlorococcus sp. MIT 1314]MCR8538804.1 class I SAM-dependent methyltransferase [Prochlorococcus marinus CUG1439]
MISYEDYAKYLSKKSFKGRLYKKFWLHKILSRNLKGKILDIGCGIGNFLEDNIEAIGVDINPYTVEICLKKNLNAKLIKQDKLPFEENSFDSCLLDNVMEHIENPDKLILEIKRILKKNGILLIGVPGIKGFLGDNDHKVNYSDNELINKLAKFGFNLSKRFYAPLPISKLTFILKQHCRYFIFKNESHI